jgi:hypothetical protein
MANTQTALDIGQGWSTALANGGIPVQAAKGLGKYIMQQEERVRSLEARLAALENAPPAITINKK